MAINLFTAPLATSPAVFASPVVSELALLVRNIDHQNRFKYGFVRKGAMFNIGGSLLSPILIQQYLEHILGL